MLLAIFSNNTIAYRYRQIAAYYFVEACKGRNVEASSLTVEVGPVTGEIGSMTVEVGSVTVEVIISSLTVDDC